MRISERDIQKTEEIAASLRVFVDGAKPGAETMLTPLRSLLEASISFAYGFASTDRGLDLDFVYASGFDSSRAGEIVKIGLQGKQFFYDPTNPQLEQRNRVLTVAGLQQLTGRQPDFLTNEVYPRAGVSSQDQIRTLICDGSDFLAFVGCFRRDPFGERERVLFQRLVPSIQRRLTWERQLRGAPFAFAALAAALEEVPAPAFVLSRTGAVVHANSSGRELRDKDRAMTTASLLSSTRGADDGTFRVTPIDAPGAPGHFLAVLRRPPADLEAKLRQMLRRYEITPRQAEVLSLLARGKCNKSIAFELGCAEGTVENHVTLLLERIGCESRCELVAKFWSGG